MSITDQIREACANVASGARHVRVAEARVAPYANSLALHTLASPAVDTSRHYVGHGDDTAAFFVTLDAINFGSGYFPHLRKRPGCSGYFTVASCLTDHFRSRGPLGASDLTRLTAQDCARIFEQVEPDAPVRELMSLFAMALNDLGHYLIDRFDGSFVKLIESSDHSAERLAELLSHMRFFNDVQTYDGRQVPFFKRAQLTAADLSIAFGKQGLGRFTDLDRLTVFADNLVPHVLRIDGILEYEPQLAVRIDREELIPADSEEEIELRACAVHACELIVRTLRASQRSVNAMGVDYLLWNRGQDPKFKGAKPRHRTRTVYY